jgi:hypothetical protein
VVLEKPTALLKFLVALELLRSGVGALALRLMTPLVPPIARLAATFETDQELALNNFLKFLDTQEGMEALISYGLGFLLPLLFFPLAIMATTRVALGLWDGYAPDLGDLGFDFKKYFASMAICFYVSLYFILIGCLLLVVLIPFAVLNPAGHSPVIGGAMAVSALAIAGLLFIRLFWPFFRRAISLQFLAFYVFLDNLAERYRVSQIFYHLERFPAHTNQAAAILVLVVVVPAAILGGTILAINPHGLLNLAMTFFFQMALTLLLLWPLTALAGFYRLVLYPPPDEPEAEAQPQSQNF